jgi:hypothetical protein
MNFARVLETIATFLHEKGQPYAVIGGVALAAYGLARTTLDLDLALDAASQEDVVRFLESLGYETIHRGLVGRAHEGLRTGAQCGRYPGAATDVRGLRAVRAVKPA